MRKIFFIFFFLTAPVILFAQNSTLLLHRDFLQSQFVQPAFLWDDNDEYKIKIESDFGWWLATNHVPFGVWDKVLRGDSITDEDQKDVVAHLKAKNIMGFEKNINLIHVNFHKGNWMMSVYLRQRTGVTILYNDNLARLAVNGNKQFAGQDINLGKFSLNYSKVNELGIGMAKQFSDKVTGGFSVNFLAGVSDMNMTNAVGWIFTADDGSYIEFENVKYRMNLSNMDSVHHQIDFSGFGLSVNAGAMYKKNEKLEYGISVNDLGAIHWFKEVKNYYDDASFRFDGVEIGSIFDFLDSTSTKQASDSALNLFKPDSSFDAYTTFTPARINLMAFYKFNDKFSAGVHIVEGLNNQPGATLRPYGSVMFRYTIHEKFSLGTNLSVGGFTNYAFGLMGTANINRFRVFISSDNVLGRILPSFGRGVDFETGLSVRF